MEIKLEVEAETVKDEIKSQIKVEEEPSKPEQKEVVSPNPPQLPESTSKKPVVVLVEPEVVKQEEKKSAFAIGDDGSDDSYWNIQKSLYD